MSCNNDKYISQAKVSKESIIKQIDYYGLNNNFEVYDYIGDSSEQYLEDTTIHLLSKDDKYHTFEKSIECFDFINKNIQYDYIFRTNTSTFINVKLLYEFIKLMKPYDTLWCSEIYSTNDVKCPNKLDSYPRGNGMLISMNLIELILKKYLDGYKTKLDNIMFENQNMISDDSCIGTILNEHFKNDSVNHLKSFTHGWYKCYDRMIHNRGNKICHWDNDNISYDYIKHFITIQLKDYINNDNIHEDKFNELTDIIINNEYDNNVLLSILHYSCNPSVFLGYFSKELYIDYDKWYIIHINEIMNRNG